MKKTFNRILDAVLILLLGVIAVSLFLIVGSLIQGNLDDALNSFFNVIYAVLALVMLSVLAPKDY